MIPMFNRQKEEENAEQRKSENPVMKETAILAEFGKVYLQRLSIQNRKNILSAEENMLNEVESKLWEEYNDLPTPNKLPEN